MDAKKSYAEIAHPCPDEDVPYLRELLQWDVACPLSCQFIRDQFGGLHFGVDPSPLHWSRTREWTWTLKEGDFAPGQKVLDIGGGWAILKFPVAERVVPDGKVVVLDTNEDGLSKAAAVVQGFKKEHLIDCVLGDARAIPYPDNHFDRVLLISVIEHIANGHLQVLKESVRVLKPGGILMLSMDIRLLGECKDNFYLDQTSASMVLSYLGLSTVSDGNCLAARMDDGVELIVALAKWYKS